MNTDYSISFDVIHSDALGKKTPFSVCQRKDFADQPVNTLLFLHGRNGDETLLEQLRTDVLLSELSTVEGLSPLRIICPRLDNSRGINSSETCRVVKGKYGDVYKGRYEDYLIHELIPHVDTQFPTKKRFIGGISSGGYTALSLGMRHSALFSKIGGHMPAVDLRYEDEDECYFADRAMWLSYDPVTLAEKYQAANVQFYLDDGLQDEGGFFRACQKLYDILTHRGVKAELHLSDGHHNASYVAAHMREYLMFYSL